MHGKKPDQYARAMAKASASLGGWVPVRVSSPTGIKSTRYGIGCSYSGTFLRHLKLLCMTIQQDPYEPDRWWFAPLLYAGVAVAIAAYLLA